MRFFRNPGALTALLLTLSASTALAQTALGSDGGSIVNPPGPIIPEPPFVQPIVQVTSIGSITIGATSSDNDRANVVSVGNSTSLRQIINVGDGQSASDAVSLRQLLNVQTTLAAQIAAITGGGNVIPMANATNTAIQVDPIVTPNPIHVNGDLSSGAVGTNAAAIGNAATANGENALALGSLANATGPTAIAIGAGATATGSIAIGAGATAFDDGVSRSASGGALASAVAVGDNSSALNGSVAMGQGAVAGAAQVILFTKVIPKADNATAVGNSSAALGDQSVAIGANAGVGIGAVKSVAIGAGASSTGQNSVALGAGSTDGGQSNVVSVGAAGAERRITNVAPGILGTDAVNVNQLATVQGQLQGQISNQQMQLASLSNQVQKINRVALGGIATAMAMGSAAPMVPGRMTLGGGAAIYSGQVGLAMRAGYTTQDGKWALGASVGTDANFRRPGAAIKADYVF